MSRSEEDRLPGALRRRALPQAGESLVHQYYARLFDLAICFIFPLMVGLIAFYAWMPHWFGFDDMRAPATTFFVVTTVICAWRAVGIRRDLKRLALGRKGERMVGEALESLIPKGYHVIHDLEQPEGFNIDHVLVGPVGVFSVETKVASYDREGKGEIRYDGKRVLVNGFAPDRDPLAQAASHARRVQEILLRTTGRTVPVQPVVIYAGRFVSYDGAPATSHAVWVMAENYLLKVLENGRRVVSEEDVRLLADRVGLEARGRA